MAEATRKGGGPWSEGFDPAIAEKLFAALHAKPDMICDGFFRKSELVGDIFLRKPFNFVEENDFPAPGRQTREGLADQSAAFFASQ